MYIKMSYPKSGHKGHTKLNQPVVRTLADFNDMFANQKNTFNFLKHINHYKNEQDTNNTHTPNHDEYSHNLPKNHEESNANMNNHNSFNDKSVNKKEAFDQFLQTLLNNYEIMHKEDESKESNQHNNKEGPSYEDKKNIIKCT
ncbi:hypothetical protein PFFCH_05730 [Plasmodium falciparum FCH/4]|uniref:Uncharacterized protein n=1 Tax=Plasmodium falciparum FCH/4 TaxID=1036724 RepID=A0A024VF66_PLAFA|nr:hypothetical protein PFFCH_05730 [Plasmodium falciparum FCH/4]